MKALADFASSEAGKTFARIERQYGRDPAAALEDDVLAHNLRAAFLITLAEEKPEDEHATSVEKTKQAGEAIRSRIG